MSHRHIAICDRCKKETLNTAHETLDDTLAKAGWIDFDIPLPTGQLSDVENGRFQSTKVTLCRSCHISLNLWWGMGPQEGKALAEAKTANLEHSENFCPSYGEAVEACAKERIE